MYSKMLMTRFLQAPSTFAIREYAIYPPQLAQRWLSEENKMLMQWKTVLEKHWSTEPRVSRMPMTH